MRSLFLCTIAAAIALSPSPSLAGEGLPPYAQVAVQCRGNEAAVRFGWNDGAKATTYNPLPPGRESWSGVPIEEDGTCRLANRQVVSIRAGTDQDYGYGEGGADPPDFFSLWIDGKKVVSRRTFRAGYAARDPYLSSMFYQASRLTACTYQVPEDIRFYVPPGEAPYFAYPDPQESPAVPVKCEASRIDLTNVRQDPLERSKARAGVGLISVAGNTSFCRRFIHRLANGEDEETPGLIFVGAAWTPVREALSLNGIHPQLPMESAWDNAEGAVLNSIYDEDGNTAAVEVAHFDLRNVGHPETVVALEGSNRFFDGDIFLVHAGRPAQEKLKALSDSRYSARPGWLVVAGGDDAYPARREMSWRQRLTHFHVFRYAGSTYLLATMTDRAVKPSAPLFRPGLRKLERVCTFQMHDENF